MRGDYALFLDRVFTRVINGNCVICHEPVTAGGSGPSESAQRWPLALAEPVDIISACLAAGGQEKATLAWRRPLSCPASQKPRRPGRRRCAPLF